MKTNVPRARIILPVSERERRIGQTWADIPAHPAPPPPSPVPPEPEPAECWCGLDRDLHDGREMDANGDNMHRFGSPLRPEKTDGPFEDSDGTKPSTPVSQTIRWILDDVRKFLDGQIVRMAQNGYKYPTPTVNAAQSLSARISALLEG